MFFTYADKQGSIFSDAWQVRQVAFDTLRRYLYYSVPLKDARVLSPIDTRLAAPTGAMTGTTTLASQQAQATLSNTTQATSLSTLTGRRSSSRISAQHAPTLRHSTADMTAMMAPVTPAAHHVATATTTTTAATPRSPVTATDAVAQTLAAPPSSPSLAHSSHSGGAFSAATAAAAATGGSTARASILPPHSPASPRASGQQQQQQWDTYSPSEVVWKKKIKVDAMVLVTKEHSFALDDVHLCEQDFFQVELYGDTRPLALGECPSPGPLLCPSAGLHGMPERCNVHNDDYLHDRFFLRELYESLRDQFINLRIERERITLAASRPAATPAATAGAVGGGSSSSAGVGGSLHSSNSGGGGGAGGSSQQQQQQQQREEEWRQPRLRTLQSPRKKGAPLQMGSRVKIVLRLRSEYEFRRFTYVVQTVLGYDKLCSRPYRGLPPYDPRNGLVFAQIPMCVWQTFRSIDKAVFYTFLRCDVVGRGSDGDLMIYLRGGYLCITHDAVLVLRDSGHVPRWVRLVDVHTFYYNSTCHRPYVVFLSDGLAPDLVLLPQHPVYGPEAIRHFSAAAETLRVRHVMHEISFASLDIRRVVHIAEAAEPSVRAFVMRYERERGTRLKFEPVVDARDHGDDSNNNNNSDNSHHRHHSSSSSRGGGVGVAAAAAAGGGEGDDAPLRDAEDNGHARASATARHRNAYPSAVVPWAMSYALLDTRDAQHPTAQQQQQQQSSRQHHHHHDSNDAAVAGGGSGRTSSLRANGPLPQEQLAQVWRDVQHIYASRDPLLVSQAAIPLYENNTNDARLTREQLDALERLMSHERASEEDIVGMSYEEIQQVELQHAVAATRRHRRERERRRQQQQQRVEGDGGGVGSSDNVEGSATVQHPRHTSRHRSRAVSLQQQQDEENARVMRRSDGGAGEADSSAPTHDRDTAVAAAAARTRTMAASNQPTSIHVYHHHGNNDNDDDDDEEHRHRSGRHGSHPRHAHSYRQQRPHHNQHHHQEGQQGQTPPSFGSLASPDETALHLPPPPPRRGSRNHDESDRDSHTRRLPQRDRSSTTVTATAAAAADGNVASPMAARDAEEASDVGNYSLRNSSRSNSSSDNRTDASGDDDDDDRERSDVSTSTASPSLLSSSSRAPSDYVVPGSRYVTREELLTQPDHLQRVLPLPVIEEHHIVVRTSPSPAASPVSLSAREQQQQPQSVSHSLHGAQAADTHVSNTSQSAPSRRPLQQQQQHGRAERTRSCSCSSNSHDEHPQQQQPQQRQCLRHARTAASNSLRSLASPRAHPNTSSLSSSSLCRRGSEGGAAVHAVHKAT